MNKNESNKFLRFISKNNMLFYILSFTWGLLASIIGLLVMIPFFITNNFKVFKRRVYGIFPESFGRGWGFEMGCFFFVSNDCKTNESVILHECGHGLQNIIWGPLMLFVISIPSAIRFWYRKHQIKHGIYNLKAYDAIWFEKQATNWGYIYFGEVA